MDCEGYTAYSLHLGAPDEFTTNTVNLLFNSLFCSPLSDQRSLET